MTPYGQIKEFLPIQGDWITDIERLSYYFEANSLTDANRKKPVLPSVCRTEIFSLLKDLITPDSLRDKIFDKLSNQTISDFITHLKNKILQIWSHYPDV